MNNVAAVGIVAIIAGAAIYICDYFFGTPQTEQPQRNAYSSNNNSNTRTSDDIPLQPSDTCMICCDKLFAPLEQLPCAHLFHTRCLMNWLKIEKTCPICRIQLSSSQIKKYWDRSKSI